MKQVYLGNIFVTINVICITSCFVIVAFVVCRFLWGFGGRGGGGIYFYTFFYFLFFKNLFVHLGCGGGGKAASNRCRFHGRAFAHGATGRRIDPLGGVCRPCHQIDIHDGPYFSFQPVLHDWCNKGRAILPVGWCI